MGRPLRVLLLLALALLGVLSFLAADDRVFGELTLLATVGLIDVEDERPLPRLPLRALGHAIGRGDRIAANSRVPGID